VARTHHRLVETGLPRRELGSKGVDLQRLVRRLIENGDAGHRERHDRVNLLRRLVFGDPKPAAGFDRDRRERLRPQVLRRIETKISSLEQIKEHLSHLRRVGHGLGELANGEACRLQGRDRAVELVGVAQNGLDAIPLMKVTKMLLDRRFEIERVIR